MSLLPPIPAPQVLTGRYVRLEPLTSENVVELVDVLARPEVFAGGWGGGSAASRGVDPGQFVDFMAGYSLAQHRPFLVRLADGRAVGTSALAEFEPANERCHLGWTAYAPQVWASPVNPETKLLLLGLVFDLGWGRVHLQADGANVRSCAAIRKLGAQYEGTLRRTQRRADGSWRDTAVFSILADEWPRVRAGLQARVADWPVDQPIWPTRPAAEDA